MLVKANLFYNEENEITSAELYTGGKEKYKKYLYLENDDEEIKEIKVVKILEQYGEEASAIVEFPEESWIKVCVKEIESGLDIHRNLYEDDLRNLINNNK